VVERAFPGFEGLKETVTVKEEWYSLKEFSRAARVLLVMRTKEMEGQPYGRPDYPLAWAKPYGAGRVWFNAMGHREDVWEADYFQGMLTGAFRWTAGQVEAELTPNLMQVAPKADELPPR